MNAINNLIFKIAIEITNISLTILNEISLYTLSLFDDLALEKLKFQVFRRANKSYW